MNRDNTIIVAVVAIVLILVMLISTIRGFIGITKTKKQIDENRANQTYENNVFTYEEDITLNSYKDNTNSSNTNNVNNNYTNNVEE